MALPSPVAASCAVTGEEWSHYLDEHAGSLDSATRRVALVEDDRTPLPESLRVLADVGRFVDDFFRLTGAGGATVRSRVRDLHLRQSEALRRLRPRLAERGVGLADWDELADDERQAATEGFCDRVMPLLVPLVAGPDRAVPPPANLALNLAVVGRDAGGRRWFAAVELPPVVPRFLRAGRWMVPVEQALAANLGRLFPGKEIEGCAAFRVTRQAAEVILADGDDILASVERQLRLERHGPIVRLEIDSSMPAELLGRLADDLDVDTHRVYAVDGMIGLADLAELAPDGGAAAPHPVSPARRVRDVFRELDDGDVLVHFPYDSYTDSVVALLDQASRDPALVGIKQTLYRPSPDGPTVRALVRAAERGAHVVAVIELAARLGERNSVACARALERAGAHVVYGVVGLRLHCPLTLVIRQAGVQLARYGVVGTGLHHPARRPEGLSLLTADADVTADLTELFNHLTGYSRPARFRRLLVGPGQLRSSLLELIRRETAAGPAGRIVLKVYRLIDGEIVDSLYRASQRGVRVDVVVFGACALRPGVAGLSENIRVLSTAGRHFETSRVLAFGSGKSLRLFLSSGDPALAHADRQIDVAAPVEDPAHRARLGAVLDALVEFPAWEMDGDGGWHRRAGGAEDVLRRLAEAGGGGGSLRR